MPTNRGDEGIGDVATTVDLARAAPFPLGHLTVVPATLSVIATGWSQRLGPRAMQVLVVLAQASAAVVGRGELNARVWGGRVVGDDAINRAVQTLRRLASEAPVPVPFHIETIPRVGYRLTAGGQAEAAAPAPVPAVLAVAPPRPGGRCLLWVVAAVAAIVAALLVWQSMAARDAAVAWRIVGSATLDDLPPGASDVALSPDGRRLAYRGEDASGRDRIYVRAAADDGAGEPVSPAGIDVRHPVWWSDGETLAFVGYDPARPCGLYVRRPGRAAVSVGTCETARDPLLAWSTDGQSLMFGDAPGENAVHRVGEVRIADGHRIVLSSPPGDTQGDDLPMPRGGDVVFQRQFGWADHGWIARDRATGRERLLWRRRGVAGSSAAVLPDGAVAIAWTRAGATGLDVIGTDGRVRSQSVALGPVSTISAAGDRLLIETDRSEAALVRAGEAAPLAKVRGRLFAPLLLPAGRLRFPVASAGMARIWERGSDGTVRPWGGFSAARIAGLALSPDGRLTAALVTGDAWREIVMFDPQGRPVFRWNPHARSVNAAAWSGDGRRLIVPVLDGAGWRLFALDPFGGAPPKDLGQQGFAVLYARGPALYAVRAGETTGVRELWRLDGAVRRLPIDLTLFDIVNWRPVEGGVWLPDRSDRERPRLVLRDGVSGAVLRSVVAPGLAGAGAGFAADTRGPVYVQAGRDAPEYSVLTLARGGR